MKFIETLKNIWKVEELRNKLGMTILFILIYRFGSFIVLPGIDPEALTALQQQTSSGLMSLLDMFSGGAFSNASIFALGIMPYISASIVVQLLTIAIPYFQKMQREGESGRNKINRITRYLTVAILLFQGPSYLVNLKVQMLHAGSVMPEGLWFSISSTLILCAGSMFVMWLGERMTDRGIGNGISILLFAGILSRAPDAFSYLYHIWGYGTSYKIAVIGIVLAFLAIVAFVVWMTNAERRIPIQYAKRVVGNKQYGGQNTHLPIKVNMSGVLPVIFASSILMVPTILLSFEFLVNPSSSFGKLLQLFSVQGTFYAIIYFLLIIGFAYFYTTIQYNPVEMANNLRKNGGAIPGIRPGKTTSDFISKILSRITLMGALFLSVIAVVPIIISQFSDAFAGISIGGTSILIMVGVALDTVTNLESQMMMRHYKGFLD